MKRIMKLKMAFLYKQKVDLKKIRDTARESHEKPICNKFKIYTESHCFFLYLSSLLHLIY